MAIRTAAVAALAMVVGGLLVFFIIGRPAPVPSGPDPRLNQLEKDVSALGVQLLSIKGLALSAAKQPEAAKAAAQDAAIASARAVSVPAPSKEEFEKKSPTAETKEADANAINNAAGQLADAQKDPDTSKVEPDCATLIANLSGDSSTALDRLKDPKSIAALKQCNAENDKKRQKDNQDYKNMGCPDDPHKPGCEQKRAEMKQDDTVAQIIKVIMVIAAIYLIMDGDVETGLLLLALANGGAGGAAGTGPGTGNDGTSNQPISTPGTSPSPPPVDVGVSKVKIFPGSGGNLICEILNDDNLKCYQKGSESRVVKVDPRNAIVDLNADETRRAVSNYLSIAIKNPSPDAIEFCAPLTNSGNGVLDQLILKHEGQFYSIHISGSDSDNKLALPATGTTQKPLCGSQGTQ